MSTVDHGPDLSSPSERVVIDDVTADPDSAGLAQLERDLAHTRANVLAVVVGYFLRPRWWVELILIGGLYGAYSAIRNSVGEVSGPALANAHRILDLEKSLGIELERPLNHLAHAVPEIAAPAALEYATLHFVLTPAVLIWLFLRHRKHYRLLSSILIVTTLLALVGFFAMPTAPPRMLGREGFFDIMSETAGWGWWPKSGAPGSDAISNQYAAMPSLHCAWATWCGIVVVLLARRTWVRLLAVIYPFSTYFVVMATGNHYLLDVLAGLATLALGAGLTLGTRYGWHRYVRWSWRHLTHAESAATAPLNLT